MPQFYRHVAVRFEGRSIFTQPLEGTIWIAVRIDDNFPKKAIILSLFLSLPLRLLFSKLIDDDTLKVVKRLVEQRFHEQLVDFDNHLDDVTLDWTNPDITKAISDH